MDNPLKYFAELRDPRIERNREHLLEEILLIAIAAVLSGAESWNDIADYGEDKRDWLQTFLILPGGIPSHDTFNRVFQALDPEEMERGFAAWVSSIAKLTAGEVVAIDGKTSRRSGGVDATELHLVSAFAAGAGMVLGQRAADEKSNEIKAIPELLSTLALTGCVVTIDAMGTQTAIASAIVERNADYVLAVKDNQPRLAESIEDFWRCFVAHPAAHTPHSFAESVEKGHGRLETRRCYAFGQLECLANPEQWSGLRSFAVLESERLIGDKTAIERRLYISSLEPDAVLLSRSIRTHWTVENRLHWCMDVVFQDDQMRARSGFAAHNLALLKHITLNLIRLDPIKRKGGLKARRLIASTSDDYRAQLLGLA